jgi:hypothetical protein
MWPGKNAVPVRVEQPFDIEPAANGQQAAVRGLLGRGKVPGLLELCHAIVYTTLAGSARAASVPPLAAIHKTAGVCLTRFPNQSYNRAQRQCSDGRPVAAAFGTWGHPALDPHRGDPAVPSSFPF